MSILAQVWEPDLPFSHPLPPLAPSAGIIGLGLGFLYLPEMGDQVRSSKMTYQAGLCVNTPRLLTHGKEDSIASPCGIVLYVSTGFARLSW